MLKLLLLFVVICSSTGEDDSLTEVYKDMGIIPNYLEQPPNGYIKVAYDQNIIAQNGIELTPLQTKDPPKIEWNAQEKTYYTIIMVCPDAPSRANPYMRENVHWLVVNIPGADIEQGDEIFPYTPLTPPKDAGLLRYVFFVFQQTDYKHFDEPGLNISSVEGHTYFNTMKFAEKYGLGQPIATALCAGRWDDFVPGLWAQLHYENVTL